MKRISIILLCAIIMALPVAHAEPEVVILPTLAPEITITQVSDPYSVDLSGYYGSDNDLYQTPSLTDTEKARVPELQARYDAGERPKESVLNKTENVVVGVYTLEPEEYQGEKVFVLLPDYLLSDEELLSLIDGYARLGLSFDPVSLSWRNCMRGGGIECNRSFARDELERYKTLTDLYKRQGLRPAQPFTAIPGDDGIGEIGLDEDEFFGLDSFSLFPCRRLTDEELLRIIQYKIGERIPDPAALGKYEAQAREQLIRLFGAPLSLKLTGESVRKANAGSVWNDEREVYSCGFESADRELSYSVLLDTATGLIYDAYITLIPYDSLIYSDLRCDPFDEKWLDIARAAVTAMRSDDMEMASVESYGESSLQHGGFCACVTVTMADGSCYELRIPFQTERVFSIDYRQFPITPEQYASLDY